MPATPKQPTVLVKKADGSSVRMTLAQLKSYKDGSVKQDPPADDAVSKPKTSRHDDTTQKIPTAVDSVVDQGDTIGHVGITNPSNQAPSKEVILSSNQNTQTTIGQATPTAADMDQLGDQQRTAQKHTPPPAGHTWDTDDHVSLLDESVHGEDLPMVIEKRRQALSRISPVKDIFVDEAAAAMHELSPSSPVPKSSPKRAMSAPVSGSVPAGKKPVLHDVMPGTEQPVAHRSVTTKTTPTASAPMVASLGTTSPAAHSTGPIDELANFTLVDFRRLSNDLSVAKQRMREKFMTLQQESYVLYMQAVAAWYRSPLVSQYQEIIERALREQQPIVNLTAADTTQQTLSAEEFKTITALHSALGL